MGKGNSKESSQAPISAFSEDELLKIKKIFNELASPSAEFVILFLDNFE
jgi:hypothetical protein